MFAKNSVYSLKLSELENFGLRRELKLIGSILETERQAAVPVQTPGVGTPREADLKRPIR